MQNLIKELRDPVLTPSGIKTPTAVMLRAANTIEHLANLHNSAARMLQELQTREMAVVDITDPLDEYRKVMNEEYATNFT